jgi:hypothetical protein
MSAILSTGGQVKPSRRKDFLAQQSQASQLNQRLGAASVPVANTIWTEIPL